MADSTVSLSNKDDSFNFYRGMSGVWNEYRPWWRRLWRWLTRQSDKGRFIRVISVDRATGTVEVERVDHRTAS